MQLLKDTTGESLVTVSVPSHLRPHPSLELVALEGAGDAN